MIKKISLIERNIMIAYALPGLGPVSMVCPSPLPPSMVGPVMIDLVK